MLICWPIMFAGLRFITANREGRKEGRKEGERKQAAELPFHKNNVVGFAA